jgi:tetratricopeptide (TPR) repeat protein
MRNRKAATTMSDPQKRLEAHRAAVEVAQRLLANAERAAPDERDALIGQAMYQLQEYWPAVEHLLVSYRRRSSAETAARLATCYWRVNDLESARRWINKAIKLEPKGRLKTLIAQTRPLFISVLAEIHLAAGDLDSAQSTASAALGLDGKDVSALHVLATVHAARGNTEDAMEMLDRAIEVAPPFIAQHLSEQQEATRSLLEANVRLQPFVGELARIQRIII